MRLRLLGCVALLFTGVAQADDGVPALLQFAEQYQRQNIGPATEKRRRTTVSQEKSVSRRSACRTTANPPHRPKRLR